MSNAKRCKLTGCTNQRGGHRSIYKGLCAEHAAAAERLGNVERSRWLARRLRVLGALGALVLGCSGPDFEGSSSSSEAAAPPDACYLEPLQHAPSSGACWRVSVEPPSLLVTCEGTIAANEEQTTRGPGYVTTAFDVAPGDCFGFYSCNGQQAPLPSVEACP